jgi:hypothetical protein
MSDAPGTLENCKPVRDRSQLYCQRCDLLWKADGPKPDCAPITFGLMRDTVIGLAADIEAFQARQVEGGWIKQPNPEEMRKASVLRRGARLLDLVANDESILALLNQKQKSKP